MKIVIGILLVLIGIGLMGYVGIYQCLVKGIISLVEIIQTGDYQASRIAWTIVRILFASTLGCLAGYPAIIGGYAIALKD